MKCNGCWNEAEAKSECVATRCGHLFCLKCAQSILDSTDSSCPVCENIVTKSTIHVVKILQEHSECQLALCGQVPETALMSALASVQFYVGQTELHFQYRERKLNMKVNKMQDACKKKLQEVHGGYTVAKRKYHEILQAKNALEADNQELQQKYSQKALQTRKLQEIVQKLQHDYDAVCRSKGMPHGQHMGSSTQGLPSWPNAPQDNLGHMVTTVHRKQVLLNPGGNAGNFLHSNQMPLAGTNRRQTLTPPSRAFGGGSPMHDGGLADRMPLANEGPPSSHGLGGTALTPPGQTTHGLGPSRPHSSMRILLSNSSPAFPRGGKLGGGRPILHGNHASPSGIGSF